MRTIIFKKQSLVLSFLSFYFYASFGQETVQPQPYFSEPAISPDASEIVFVSGGDLWTMPANGTVANLLVSHAAYESRPVYSPDGRSLAFISTRTGNGDIYILELASGKLDRLTHDDAPDELSAWSSDGYIYFSSVSKDISGMKDIFRVRATGGTPMAISKNRYVTEFFAMPSPDAKTIALSARGSASAQWWRNGRSHMDESEIWLLQPAQGKYEKLVSSGAKNLWPMWASDGKALYYVSDKTGKENLYLHPINGTVKQLTDFKSGRMLWPSIAANGKAIVFERDFNIWYYDVATAKAKQLNITRLGMPATTVVEHRSQTNDFRGLSLSPDGKKIVFAARGDLFLSSAKEGGDAKRLTKTPATEGGVAWAPNSNSIVYTANREDAVHLYEYNFLTNTERQLTAAKEDDLAPEFSPDGKFVAFMRNGTELRKLNLQNKTETLVTKGYLGMPIFASSSSYTWSPDGRWIAYIAQQAKALENLHIVSANGGEGKPISFLANSNSDDVSWSKDGKYILYSTNQRTENRNIARVDLVKQLPKFREEQIQKMFTDPMLPATPAPAPPRVTAKKISGADTLFKSSGKSTADTTTVIEWDGIAQRLNLLPLDLDVADFKISPDGNTLALISSVAGQQNIFTYSLDELAKEAAVLKQLTTTASPKNTIQFSPDGKEIYFLEQGRIQSVNLDSRQAKPVGVTAELDVDFDKEKMEVFKQAWELQNKGFYDPEFHGANWNAVKKTYEPLVAGAATSEEMRRILSLMVGELNASHLGVSGPQATFPLGRLGLQFDRVEYENMGRFRISDVLEMGPSALGSNIQVGDYLVAVDGFTLKAATNIDELLNNKVGKMVTLAIAKQPNGGSKNTSVRPVNLMAEKNLFYKQWVQAQRDYVNKISKGRLGYVHMQDMSAESLNQLHLDLDADNHSREGVVVDVRNNNGGFVNSYAIDVLARRGYLNMKIRDLPTAPGRVQLGQRALDAPTILVTNQHSLSDAEDFTEGYRSLNLGKVVGEPTAGWIIFTTNVPLFDGTTIRLPFMRITDLKGKDMELNPRPVDIEVSNPLGQTGNDNQLDTAVEELLKQIDGGKK